VADWPSVATHRQAASSKAMFSGHDIQLVSLCPC
jgi:hypothetical protein